MKNFKKQIFDLENIFDYKEGDVIPVWVDKLILIRTSASCKECFLYKNNLRHTKCFKQGFSYNSIGGYDSY